MTIISTKITCCIRRWEMLWKKNIWWSKGGMGWPMGVRRKLGFKGMWPWAKKEVKESFTRISSAKRGEYRGQRQAASRWDTMACRLFWAENNQDKDSGSNFELSPQLSKKNFDRRPVLGGELLTEIPFYLRNLPA